MFTGIFIAVSAFVAVLFVILLVLETRTSKEIDKISSRISDLALHQVKLRTELDQVKRDLEEAEKDREARKEQEERFYTGVNNILKQAIKEAGVKAAVKCVQKIPGNVLVKVNQKVGFRLFTKFGSKGVVNLGKAVPVVGGIISGGFDFAETKIIAHRAYKLFIQGNFDSPDFSDPEFDTVVRTDITSIK